MLYSPPTQERLLGNHDSLSIPPPPPSSGGTNQEQPAWLDGSSVMDRTSATSTTITTTPKTKTLVKTTTTPTKSSSSSGARRRRVTSDTELMAVSPYSKSSVSSALSSSSSSSCCSSPPPPPPPLPPLSSHSASRHSPHPKSPPPLKKSKLTQPRLVLTTTPGGTSSLSMTPAATTTTTTKNSAAVSSLSPRQRHFVEPHPAPSVTAQPDDSKHHLRTNHHNHNNTSSPSRATTKIEWHAANQCPKARAAVEVTDGSSEIVANVVQENHHHYRTKSHATSIHQLLRHEQQEQPGAIPYDYQAEIQALAERADQHEQEFVSHHVHLSSRHEQAGDLVSSLHALEHALQAVSVQESSSSSLSSFPNGGGACVYPTLMVSHPLRRGTLLYRSGLILWKMGNYVLSMARLRQAQEIHRQEQRQPQQATTKLQSLSRTPIRNHKNKNESCSGSSAPGWEVDETVVATAVGVGKGCWSETMTEIQVALGKVSLSMGDTKQAKRYFIQALRMIELDCLLLDQDESLLYYQQMQLLKAKILRQLASLFMMGLEEDSSPEDTIDSIQRQKSCHKAETALSESLQLQQTVLGSEACMYNTDYALTMVTYGQFHELQGDYLNAAIMYLDALDIYRQCYAQESSSCNSTSSCRTDMAVAVARIGWLHYLNKDYQEARSLYLEAYDLIYPLLGQNHANIASLHVKIGMIYAATKQWSRALKRYRTALEIQRHVHGGNHNKSVAQTLCLIAVCYSERQQQPDGDLDNKSDHDTKNTTSPWETQRDLHRALQCWHHALRIRLDLLGRGHLLVAKTLVPLGKLQHRLSQIRPAVESISGALEIYNSHGFTSDHPLVQEARAALQRSSCKR